MLINNGHKIIYAHLYIMEAVRLGVRTPAVPYMAVDWRWFGNVRDIAAVATTLKC